MYTFHESCHEPCTTHYSQSITKIIILLIKVPLIPTDTPSTTVFTRSFLFLLLVSLSSFSPHVSIFVFLHRPKSEEVKGTCLDLVFPQSSSTRPEDFEDPFPLGVFLKRRRPNKVRRDENFYQHPLIIYSENKFEGTLKIKTQTSCCVTNMRVARILYFCLPRWIS